MVRFGHDGWSGQLAREITVDSITSVARAAGIAMVRDYPDDARLVVGFDRRFMADTFAGVIARELAALGIEIVLIPRPVPPAALTLSIQEMEAVGGIMVTAGNQPPTMSGIKLRGWDGGALPRWMLDYIEESAASSSAAGRIGPTAQVFRHDPIDKYLASIASNVPARAIRESGITAVIDAHWGVGSELVPRLTDGSGSRSVEIRSAHNPLFPDLSSLSPAIHELDRLRRLVRTGDAALGLALSADGTALGLLDEHGTPVPADMLAALIVWYLTHVEGERGAIGRSISASTSLDQIAQNRNIPVHELPHGYTAVCEAVRESSPMLVINEHSGIALTDHQYEPDAIVTAALVMACLVRTGSELSEVIEEVRSLTGDRNLERVRIELTRDQIDRVTSWLGRTDWPDEVAGYPVNQVYIMDGVKFEIDEDSWLLLRYDEREEVLEIAAESASPGVASQILGAGRQMILSQRWTDKSSG